MATATTRANAKQGRRCKVRTLVALALAALETAGRLDEVPALRVSRSDCRRLVSPHPLTRLPPLAALCGLAEIRLSNVGLGRVPQALAALSRGLLVLNLARNRLVDVPRWVGRFMSLRVLDLAANRLTRVPLCVGDLTALARLDLSQNRLASIPAWFGPALTGLRQLNLCSTFVRGPRLPPSFGDLVGLRHLSLCCSPTLAPAFASWEDTGAADAAHPLWAPVYDLTGLRGLVVHNTSVIEVDARIGRLRNLTRIEGLYLATRVPPELAKIRGLAHMDTCHFAVSLVPHEFYALAKRMRPRCRPLVDGAVDGTDDGATRARLWSLPSLVDLCLTVLCATTGAQRRDTATARRADGDNCHTAESVDDSTYSIDDDSERDAWDDSGDDRPVGTKRAWASGGGPFARDRDPGLFYVDDGGGGECDAALLGLPWYDDRGDLSAGSVAPAVSATAATAAADGDADEDKSACRHPLPNCVRCLLPVELVERAEGTWSRTCASCKHPIIGAASLVDTVRARSPPFPLWGRSGADPFLGVERAFCPRCAPSIAAAPRSTP
ncbi:Leucin rich repeat domain containing protein [Pandoravirus salinus]|uniref:Leucin rich repeat domain containing protein n=1 Tax=Pandoravirus salinus TaxID=1349410 RepID=S4VZD7_9VIRU|nr:Leucin rich repeat domain [Pandoravirus salinus]AGO83402.1 Leucin rich repeat domain containing protein [Pandoravirus salinus]